MAYLSQPNKRDQEILRFAKRMTHYQKNGPRIYTTPLGFYEHCANEYEVLVVGASRKLVRKIWKAVREG
jgi:hypothetical protein